MISNDELAYFFKEYRNALFVLTLENGEIIYSNDIATSLYGITLDTEDVTYIFPMDYKIRKENVSEVLKKDGFSIIYDLITLTKDGREQLADVQVDFLNQDKKAILIEIRPKNDIRMEMALNQINHATRPEGILVYDEKLTVLHNNELFHDVFDGDENLRFSHYNNYFSNGFCPESRENLLEEIHKNLKKNPVYFTKAQIITTKGERYWYSLELQRRTLDNTGIEKVMVFMVNIESQVELEETHQEVKKELKSLNQYFDVMQELSDDFSFALIF